MFYGNNYYIDHIELIHGKEKGSLYLSYIHTFQNVLKPTSTIFGPRTNAVIGKYIKSEIDKALNGLTDAEVFIFLDYLFKYASNESLIKELKYRENEYILPSYNSIKKELIAAMDADSRIGY